MWTLTQIDILRNKWISVSVVCYVVYEDLQVDSETWLALTQDLIKIAMHTDQPTDELQAPQKGN